MPEIEERTAKIEGILEQMSERINDLRADFTSLRAEVRELRQEMRSEIGGLRQEMGSLRQEVHDNFRWMMATLIGSWATIVGVIIAMLAIVR